MADNDDKWRREHTNATQQYVFELVTDALDRVIAHEIDQRDEADADLRRDVVALINTARHATYEDAVAADTRMRGELDAQHSQTAKAIIAASVETMGHVNDAVAELAKAIAHETDRRDEEDGGLTQRIDALAKHVDKVDAALHRHAVEMEHRVRAVEARCESFAESLGILDLTLDALAKQVAGLEAGRAPAARGELCD